MPDTAEYGIKQLEIKSLESPLPVKAHHFSFNFLLFSDIKAYTPTQITKHDKFQEGYDSYFVRPGSYVSLFLEAEIHVIAMLMTGWRISLSHKLDPVWFPRTQNNVTKCTDL